MIAGLLAIANMCMRPRLVNKKSGALVPGSLLVRFASDPPYLLTVISNTLVLFGLFFPQFYIQLDAIEHGVDQTFAFYTIAVSLHLSRAAFLYDGNADLFFFLFFLIAVFLVAVAQIMNAASFVGRVVPSFIAHNFGVVNMMLACTLACGVLIFAMLAVTDLSGTIAFSILYGFFSGSCECHHHDHHHSVLLAHSGGEQILLYSRPCARRSPPVSEK
jgi:MFS transporter, MCT family, solute carrier family 16 (monocarboxylic acid transporters), member 10